MKNKYLTSVAVSIILTGGAHAATVIFEDDFESSSVKTTSYAGHADDDLWVKQSGDFIAIQDLAPDAAPFSSGNELTNGFKFETNYIGDYTLGSTTAVWDEALDYTISISIRSYDSGDTDGGVAGNFILGARDTTTDDITFLGKNIAFSMLATEGWETYTHTMTGAEVTTAGIDGQLFFVRLSKSGQGAGGSSDFMLADNFSITAIPEPSSTALLGLGGLALMLRRRR